MKRHLLAALAAFGLAFGASAAGELTATGADVKTYHVGAVGGGAFTNLTLGNPRTIAPWKVFVTNAVKKTATTSSKFVATNYVVTATVACTNLVPVLDSLERTVTNKVYMAAGDASAWSNHVHSVSTNTTVATNALTRLAVSNAVVTATLTCTRLTLDNLPAPWTVASTNGYTATVTNYATTAAGGKVTLKNGAGDSWEVTLSDGAGALAATPDLTKLVFAGELTATSTEAEKADVRVTYLTFNQ